MKTLSQAEYIFACALEKSEAEREKFVEESCGSDEALRSEVQQLLAKGKKVDSFFGDDEQFSIQVHQAAPGNFENEGDQVGPYKLRQQLGEGGFGVVWMAEQTGEISRMVAIKIVKAGMDTKEVLNRFEAERQALAMMEHPNIARIFDAGATEAGRPYFAMELVKGVPITEFCDQQKYGSSQRLELFTDICSAVNHAHQKGIIHRDLKPSNVMVTLHGDRPVVKIIDFGIAKATQTRLTEKTMFTHFGSFLGTPAYMSPEQAAMSGLDIDTRSDIYSIGVLLYQLLASETPFEQKSLLSVGYDEMRRILLEDEPMIPSNRLTQIRDVQSASGAAQSPISPSSLKGELDWIVMKAIDKDRARRYATADSFAADIKRFLADEPVLAVASTTAYKLKKFAKRYKAALTVATMVVFLLIAGIAATTQQAIRATKEKERAIKAEQLAGLRLQETKEALKETEAITSLLGDILKTVMPFTENSVQSLDIADIAAKRLNAANKISPRQKANLQSALAEIYHDLSQFEKAIELREAVAEHFENSKMSEGGDSILAKVRLSDSYEAAAFHLRALNIRQEALRLSRSVHGARGSETIRVMEKLANSHEKNGDFEKALDLRKEVSPTHVFSRIPPLAVNVGIEKLHLQIIQSPLIWKQVLSKFSTEELPKGLRGDAVNPIMWFSERLKVTIDPVSREAIISLKIDGATRDHAEFHSKCNDSGSGLLPT